MYVLNGCEKGRDRKWVFLDMLLYIVRTYIKRVRSILKLPWTMYVHNETDSLDVDASRNA